MSVVVVLMAHFGHGFGALFSTIAHAAIWSIVGRIVWHLPVVGLVIAGVLAAAFLLRRAGRGRAK